MVRIAAFLVSVQENVKVYFRKLQVINPEELKKKAIERNDTLMKFDEQHCHRNGTEDNEDKKETSIKYLKFNVY